VQTKVLLKGLECYKDTQMKSTKKWYIYIYICGYELPTNLQNFTQKEIKTKVKIFQTFRGGGLLLKHAA